MKSLGKVSSNSLRDNEAIKAGQELEKNLMAVDKLGLPGNFKTWIYKHVILLQPLSTAEGFEWKISHYLHRWLGLPLKECHSVWMQEHTDIHIVVKSDRKWNTQVAVEQVSQKDLGLAVTRQNALTQAGEELDLVWRKRVGELGCIEI